MKHDPDYACLQDEMIARYDLPVYPVWQFEYQGTIYESEAPTSELALQHIAEAIGIPVSAIDPDEWELI
jgi:hypothetical protein